MLPSTSVSCGCWRATGGTHAKDATAQMAELKADWCRVQKLLGKSRDKTGSLMPGWIVVQRRLIYDITRQLGRWTQLSLLRVSGGSQLPALHRRLLLPCPAPSEARQTRRRNSGAANDAPGSDAPETPSCACPPRPHYTVCSPESR